MSAQFGPHRWSAGYHDAGNNDAFRGCAALCVRSSRRAFVDCDLSQVKIVDSTLVDVDMSGYVDHLVVNGVDVTEFVKPSSTGGTPNACSCATIRERR